MNLIPHDDFQNMFDQARQELSQIGRQQRKVMKQSRHEIHRLPNGTVEVWEDTTILIEDTFLGRIPWNGER